MTGQILQTCLVHGDNPRKSCRAPTALLLAKKRMVFVALCWNICARSTTHSLRHCQPLNPTHALNLTHIFNPTHVLNPTHTFNPTHAANAFALVWKPMRLMTSRCRFAVTSFTFSDILGASILSMP